MIVPFPLRNLPSSWLTEAERASLERPEHDVARAAVAAGRLIRAGLLRADEARACRAWLRDALEPAQAYAVHAAIADWSDGALEWIRRWAARDGGVFDAIRQTLRGEVERKSDDDAPFPATWPVEVVGARDDVESALASLAIAAVEREDDEVAAFVDASREAASGVDRVVVPVLDELTEALRASGVNAPPHVRAFGELEPEEWWIGAVVRAGWAPQVREALRAAAQASPAVTLPASARVSLQMGSSATGATVDDALSRDLGAPLSTMHDGEVLVWAVGFGRGEEDFAPGLVIRARENRLDRIAHVALDPPGPRATHRDAVALAIWVPLADVVGRHDLIVRIAERDERLPLDLVAAEAP